MGDRTQLSVTAQLFWRPLVHIIYFLFFASPSLFPQGVPTIAPPLDGKDGGWWCGLSVSNTNVAKTNSVCCLITMPHLRHYHYRWCLLSPPVLWPARHREMRDFFLRVSFLAVLKLKVATFENEIWPFLAEIIDHNDVGTSPPVP
jgi:hypothetical protein